MKLKCYRCFGPITVAHNHHGRQFCSLQCIAEEANKVLVEKEARAWMDGVINPQPP